MKIILDPGHGGSDTGAVAFGLAERDLNLVFARLLAAKLEQLRFEVDKTLINSKYYTPAELTGLIKESGAQLCISCHNNSFDGSARGLEVIHSIHSEGELAKLIIEDVGKTGFPVRRIFSRESASRPNEDYYYVIRLTYPKVETIIVEFGFIDNSEDFKMLTSSAWQDRLTSSVAAAVHRYINGETNVKTQITGRPILTPDQLKKALSDMNANSNSSIVDTYYRIAQIYGVKADLAFLQAMLETNWLKFTGIVKPEQNNFAGLGATGGGNNGEWFDSVEEGVEAHIQHLYAYSTVKPLPAGRPLYDTRFYLVKRGSAPNWEDLNGKWAVPGYRYGENIVSLQRNIFEKYSPQGSNVAPVDDKPAPSTSTHWAKPCNDELMQAGILYNDHSETLDKPASEGMVICLVNRLRKEFLKNN